MIRISIFLLLLSIIRGQDGLVPQDPAIAEWNTLRGAVNELGKGANLRTSAERLAAASANAKTAANQFRDFRAKYPDHPLSSTARCEEASALIRAALYGDTGNDDRIGLLLRDVRLDQALTPIQRFRVVAWSQQIPVARAKPISSAARMLMFEANARLLIAEFPSIPDGYESLYAVARDSEPTVAKRILSDLLASQAPDSLKAQSALALHRLRLIGENIRAIFTELKLELPTSLKESVGAALIYTWSDSDSSSLKKVKQTAEYLQIKNLIGIRMTIPELGVIAASPSEIPGSQIVVQPAQHVALLNRLGLGSAGLVLVLDADGFITKVNPKPTRP